MGLLEPTNLLTAEGTTEDVLFYVDADQVIDLWDDLVLPRSVRQARAEWILQHRNVEIAC